MTQTQGNGTDNQQCKERKMRRLWKSFSEDPGVGLCQDSEEKKDESAERKRFGSVLPALRLQLAEQGDPGAQMELARELLVSANMARREEAEEEEAGEWEEAAVFWLIRAAEEGEEEAMATLQVRSSNVIVMSANANMMTRAWWRRTGE